METFSTLLEIGEGIHRSPVGYPPVSPTPDQNVYHTRTHAWKTPPFRGFWTKKTPFSTEIADFDVQ